MLHKDCHMLKFTVLYVFLILKTLPIPVAARGCTTAAIAGSNLPEDKEVYLLCVLCIVR